jgi:hypothetical protein
VAERDGMILIKCPNTGKEVFTGMKLDARSFEVSDFKNQWFNCSDCKQRHIWSKKDAFLKD